MVFGQERVTVIGQFPRSEEAETRDGSVSPYGRVKARGSDIEAEVEDVAVLDRVILAFEAELAGIACPCFAAEYHIVVIGDGLGADEALFEVGMNHAGGFGRPGLAPHGPGPRLLRPHGEERDEVEQRITRTHDSRET